MGYTNEQLDAIAAKLKAMPIIEKPKRQHSKQEAVKLLSKEIALLQKRGYTLEQISETLRGEGLDITTPTLKSYLQRSKSGKNKEQKGQNTDTKKDSQKAQSGRISPAPKNQSSTHQSNQTSSTSASFIPTPDSEEI